MTEPQRSPLHAAPVEEWRVQLANIERQVTECLVAGERQDWTDFARHANAIVGSGEAMLDWAGRRKGTP